MGNALFRAWIGNVLETLDEVGERGIVRWEHRNFRV
jgi:hypothetical protein